MKIISLIWFILWGYLFGLVVYDKTGSVELAAFATALFTSVFQRVYSIVGEHRKQH